MFVDTRINTCTCTHKTRQNCNSLSLLPFQENCLLFFALFNSLLFLKFERGGGCNPRIPPPTLDPPMTCTFVPANPFSRISFCAYINYPNFFETEMEKPHFTFDDAIRYIQTYDVIIIV